MQFYDIISPEAAATWKRMARERLVDLMSPPPGMRLLLGIPPGGFMEREAAEAIVAKMTDEEIVEALRPTHCPECGQPLPGED